LSWLLSGEAKINGNNYVCCGITQEAKASDVSVAVQGNFAKKTKMLIALQHEIMIIIKTTFYILRIFL
jgi:hypothetical protein